MVDSSKRPKRLAVLAEAGVDLHVVHLTRDGRGVAYSNVRKERDFWAEVRRWRHEEREAALGLAALRPDVPRIHVRYEDLALEPAATMRGVFDWLGVPAPEETWRSFRDRDVHIVSGNRMARTRRSEIAFDDEYLTGISARDWVTSTEALLVPLRRLGYPLRRGPLRDRVADRPVATGNG